MTHNTVNLDQELNQIKRDIKEIKEQLSTLIALYTKIDFSCNKTKEAADKMTSHISLVENIYSSVRSPLEFMRRRFYSITSRVNAADELPMLK
jgi:septation ring formation regulator EzrA